jgi:RNA polymerase sigma-70 factor (ECF subfamily)
MRLEHARQPIEGPALRPSPTHPDESERLIEGLQQRDEQALTAVFDQHRDYLRQVVRLRMDAQMSARVDPSDVIQEAYLQAFRRLEGFLSRRPLPLRIWLRETALECLLQLRRKHVGAQARSVKCEVCLPEQSSILLAGQAVGDATTPSQHALRGELATQVQQALTQLSDEDREMLLVRNYEGLTNQEAAYVFGISGEAARKRYTRALLRLRGVLAENGVTRSQS